MKKCPNCGQIFADDNLFCLDDGAVLEFGQTSGDRSYPGDIPTVVMPKYSAPTTSQTVPHQSQNKWTYPIIGVLAGLVVVLGFLAFYKLNLSEKPGETAAIRDTANKEAPIRTPFETPVQMPNQPQQMPRPPITNAGSLPGRFPEASARLLTSGDLYGKTNWDLRIMRNEIFARYGYIFKNADLRNYFLNQPWYRPQFDDVGGFLNEVEKKNVMFLKRYE